MFFVVSVVSRRAPPRLIIMSVTIDVSRNDVPARLVDKLHAEKHFFVCAEISTDGIFELSAL